MQTQIVSQIGEKEMRFVEENMHLSTSNSNRKVKILKTFIYGAQLCLF